MKKIILLLIMVLTASMAFGAGTEYHNTFDTTWPGTADSLNAADSLEGSNWYAGFDRWVQQFGMTSTGDVIAAFTHRTATSGGAMALKTSDWGANWHFDRIILGPATVIKARLSCYGDSCYTIGQRVSVDSPIYIGKYLGITPDIDVTAGSKYDSLPIVVLGTVNKDQVPCFKMHGNKLLVFADRESGTPDSGVVLLSGGALADTSTWTAIDSVARYGGIGLRAAFEWAGGSKGGIMLYEQSSNDFLWYDTVTSDLDTLNAAFLAYNDGTYQSFTIVPVKDSFGLAAYQLGLGDDLWLKYFNGGRSRNDCRD
jgi:hypothetical protein